MGVLLWMLLGLLAAYLLVCLIGLVVVQELPRRPVVDPPDWGDATDTRIPAVDGRQLEVWRIEPDVPGRGIVLLSHGWGRNRDRMVHRARIFGDRGYTTVLFSARDHGNSDKRWFMNAFRFAEDMEAVMNWIGEPVILYGHSAGSGGAMIAAARNPERVRLLIAEGVYVHTREALLSLYRWVNPVFGKVFGPTILTLMNLIYRGGLTTYSPARLAPEIRIPVLIVHGENDTRFPAEYARRLVKYFSHPDVQLFVAPGAGHSDASHTPGYEPALDRFLNRYDPVKKS
jgi:pimeloyl-ACP methyl ester carboxylesterase